MTLYRVIYEVHSIIRADLITEAEETAEKLAKQFKWIVKTVIRDNPLEDESYKYPTEVKEYIEKQRRRHR